MRLARLVTLTAMVLTSTGVGSHEAVQVWPGRFEVRGTGVPNDAVTIHAPMGPSGQLVPVGFMMTDNRGWFAGSVEFAAPLPDRILVEHWTPGAHGPGGPKVTVVPLVNRPPALTLSVTPDPWFPSSHLQVSGQVFDEVPEGLIVTVDGVPTGAGHTATVGRDGRWSITLQRQPYGGGPVRAWVVDWYGAGGTAWVNVP